MAIGRPPKPVEVKRRTGNPGKRPLRSAMTTIAPVIVLDPVSSLGLSGHDLIQTLLNNGASAWIGATDRPGLLQFIADGWDERRFLIGYIEEHGRSYQSFSKVSGEQWKTRPEVEQLAALEKRLTTWFSLAGLTPTDRSRLGVSEVKVLTRLEAVRQKRLGSAG